MHFLQVRNCFFLCICLVEFKLACVFPCICILHVNHTLLAQQEHLPILENLSGLFLIPDWVWEKKVFKFVKLIYSVNTIIQLYSTGFKVCWENSLHFMMQQMVSVWNYIWELYTEIPYWWCFITTWVLLLIGWNKCSHMAQPIRSSTQIWPGIDVSSVWNFCGHVSDVISWGNQGYVGITKCWLFSQTI